MKIEIGETDRFELRRAAPMDVDENSLVLDCPRCGKEVVLNARSSSGEEDSERHPQCRMTFELRPTGYDLIIKGNG